MAAALLAARLEERGIDAHVHSAGLLSDGRPATDHGIAVMAERGLDTSAHRSRRLDPPLIVDADLVLALARSHLREVVAARPDAFGRSFTLKEIVRRGEGRRPRRKDEPLAGWLDALHLGRRPGDLVGSSSDDDVDDPVGGPRRAYDRTARELDDLTARLAALITG